RTSGKLLKHFEIETRMFSYHKFNEHTIVEKVVERILSGDNAALISDAGTPAISDPGYLVVRHCIDAGIDIECLPGATAFVPALITSGLPNDKFLFEGFLPIKKGRKTRIEALREEKNTMVFYESPHRLLKTLNQLSEALGGERKGAVCREISKIYEETIRGTLKELCSHFEQHIPKGEIVLIVNGKKD
ncbi:MAG: 16S rRNA (cytidine(1402)-2'-O)-methyltransferase, partial [Bacteroidota bacterium]